MTIAKEEFITFKNSAGYEACKKDVSEAVENAVREMVMSEAITPERHHFLKGFIMGCSSMLDWEPTYEEVMEADDA